MLWLPKKKEGGKNQIEKKSKMTRFAIMIGIFTGIFYFLFGGGKVNSTISGEGNYILMLDVTFCSYFSQNPTKKTFAQFWAL